MGENSKGGGDTYNISKEVAQFDAATVSLHQHMGMKATQKAKIDKESLELNNFIQEREGEIRRLQVVL